jgi:hypothetical protein
MKDRGERFYIQSIFLGNSLEEAREEILDSFFEILSSTAITKDIKVVKFIEENIPEIKKVYIAQKKFIRDELEKYWRQQTLDETFEEETEIFKIKAKISLALEQIQNANSDDVERLTQLVKNHGTDKFREERYKAQEKEYYEKLEEKFNKLNQQWEAIPILKVSSEKSSEQKNEDIADIIPKGFLEARDKEFNKLESKLDELIKEQKKIRVNELNELIERLNGFEKEKIQSKKEEQTKEEQEKEEQEKERFIYKIEKQITKEFNWLLRAEYNNDKKADEENINPLYELYPKILKIFKK